MINWEKKGLIIDKAMDGFTHASHPSMIQIENDKFLMAFSSRKINRAIFFYAMLKL